MSLTTAQLQNLCLNLLPGVKSTGAYIREQYSKREHIHFQTKAKNEVVSFVDQTAEQQLVKAVQQLVPEAGFLTEEKTVIDSEKDFQWIIDPVDGTTNFYYGIPFFAVSVALIHKQNILLGVVLDVMHNDIYYAWKGGGCFFNGTPSFCTSLSTTEEVFLATGIPNYDFERKAEYLSSLNQLIDTTRGIRRLGSAALELAYVAAGRFNAFFESGLKPWDTAASVCLIKEAGGLVTDLQGGTDYLYGKSILAASKEVHPLLLKKLQNIHT